MLSEASIRSGLAKAFERARRAERQALLEEVRAGKIVQVWKGKGKWLGLANLSLRSPGSLVIGNKRKAEEKVGS